MPELPEVETTRRGIAPHIVGQRVTNAIVREPRMRWPIPRGLVGELTDRRVESVERRGKYLLLRTDAGTLILHLGMSGSLRLVPAELPPNPHDHFDLVFAGGLALRLRDPRRFGAVLWTRRDPLQHERLRDLGPEPLDAEMFTGAYLHQRAHGRRQSVKAFIMDSQIVVGVGNIYASESLFLAGIHPSRAAGRIALPRFERLADCIRAVLEESIRVGGTTLRDFRDSNGQPGYFAQQLRAYGRAGEACPQCAQPIRQITLGQRSTYYCPGCQR